MRWFLIVLLLAVAGCTQVEPDDSQTPTWPQGSPDEPPVVIDETDEVDAPRGATLCTSPRPEICTAIYQPVCGEDGRTYGNGCVACQTVNWYFDGECTPREPGQPQSGPAGQPQQPSEQGGTAEEPEPTGDFIFCTSPRPEICTQQYSPVCGTVDTGIRCVTEPCPSEEQVTFTNGCIACSNSSVSGYYLGSC